MSVPRFDLGPHQMTPASEGAYVRYEDYAKLERWKEEAQTVVNDCQLQEVGKELGVPLGGLIAPAILPGIRALKAENAALKEEVQMVRNANSLLSEQFMKFQDAVAAQQTRYGPIPEDKR